MVTVAVHAGGQVGWPPGGGLTGADEALVRVLPER